MVPVQTVHTVLEFESWKEGLLLKFTFFHINFICVVTQNIK